METFVFTYMTSLCFCFLRSCFQRPSKWVWSIEPFNCQNWSSFRPCSAPLFSSPPRQPLSLKSQVAHSLEATCWIRVVLILWWGNLCNHRGSKYWFKTSISQSLSGFTLKSRSFLKTWKWKEWYLHQNYSYQKLYSQTFPTPKGLYPQLYMLPSVMGKKLPVFVKRPFPSSVNELWSVCMKILSKIPNWLYY